MTNKKLYMLAAVLVATAIGCSPVEAPREAQRYTIEQFLNTTSIGGGSFSHDEKTVLYASDASGVVNAYTVPATGGTSTQLTHSTEDNVFPVSFFPSDDRILYRGDRGGNELYHIHLREEDGTVKDLTPGEKNRAQFNGWAYDEKSFLYQSNLRDPRYMDLYEMDIATFKPRMIFKNERFAVGPVSRDKRYVALNESVTNHDSNIHLYDAETKETKLLTPHEGEVTFFAVTFSPDAKNLYFVTNENSEFWYLKRMDLASGDSETVAEAEWDIMFAQLSREGKYLMTAVNNDARTEISIVDTTTNQPVEMPDLPDGDVTSVAFSKSEKLIRFLHSGARSPSNLFVYDIEAKKYAKLTDTLSPDVDTEDLVETEVVRYKSFDGLEIPAVLMKPHLKPGEKAPALVQVHGGPGGQSRTGYSEIYQYLANHGYVILRVNNRGSSGYGKRSSSWTISSMARTTYWIASRRRSS